MSQPVSRFVQEFEALRRTVEGAMNAWRGDERYLREQYLTHRDQITDLYRRVTALEQAAARD